MQKPWLKLLLPSFSPGPLSYLFMPAYMRVKWRRSLNHTVVLACKCTSNSGWWLDMSQGSALLLILWWSTADVLSNEKALSNLVAHPFLRICFILSSQSLDWVWWREVERAWIRSLPTSFLNSIEVNRGALPERIKAGRHVLQVVSAQLWLWGEPGLPGPTVSQCLMESESISTMAPHRCLGFSLRFLCHRPWKRGA